MNVLGGFVRMPGWNPSDERAEAVHLVAAKRVVAALGLAVGMFAGLPALAAQGGSNFPLLSFQQGVQTPLTAPRSVAAVGNNSVAKIVYIVNDGNNVINDAKVSIAATTPLTETSFVDCSMNGASQPCPADASGTIVNGVYQTTFAVFSPHLKIGVLVVAPTPTAGAMTIQGTVTVNNTTGGGKPLTTKSDPFSISLGAAAPTVVSYIPNARGQLTAIGLDPADSPLVNALATVVTVPAGTTLTVTTPRLGKIQHGVDLNSCSAMWAVCLHSGINIPESGDPATFVQGDPLKVLLRIDGSSFNPGAKFSNVIVQYKALSGDVPVDVVPCNGTFLAPLLPDNTDRCYLKDDGSNLKKQGNMFTGFGQIVVLEKQNGFLLAR